MITIISKIFYFLIGFLTICFILGLILGLRSYINPDSDLRSLVNAKSKVIRMIDSSKDYQIQIRIDCKNNNCPIENYHLDKSTNNTYLISCLYSSFNDDKKIDFSYSGDVFYNKITSCV